MQFHDERRFGRFTLPMTTTMEGTALEDMGTIGRRIMGRCVVLRAEAVYHTLSIEYVATSPDFDPVPPGALLPVYKWEVTGDEVRAVRQPL